MRARHPGRPGPATVFAGILLALASLGALLGLVLRAGDQDPPWARWLTLHSGNVAVGGFVLAACYPGAWLERSRHRALRRLGAWLLPLAALLWGAFFVAMELLPLYAANVRDPADVPFALLGVGCGWVVGRTFQRRLAGP